MKVCGGRGDVYQRFFFKPFYSFEDSRRALHPEKSSPVKEPTVPLEYEVK